MVEREDWWQEGGQEWTERPGQEIIEVVESRKEEKKTKEYVNK